MSEAIDNSAARSMAFDALLEAMLGGGNAAAVVAAERWIGDARPEDLVGAVDRAVARGIDTETLKPPVSRLVNLLSAPLSARWTPPPETDRLFSSLSAENAGLTSVMERGKASIKAINGADDRRLAAAAELAGIVAELEAVEIHYRKLENVVFPWFESAYPEYRCVRLMWDIHDDARRGLKECAAILDGIVRRGTPDFDAAALNKALGRLYFDLGAMAFREDKALYPVMIPLIDQVIGARLFIEAAEYGYAFLDDDARARFEAAQIGASRIVKADSARSGGAATGRVRAGGAPGIGEEAGGFSGRTGALPGRVLEAIFSAMPVDMTWVDADDKVRWFSDSPARIFPRSPAILGRDVRNCHPGASVGRVMALIDAFRRGERDRESFWISMGDRFIHIEYFALRDAGGAYMGTLEVSQDATGLRALEGEKRLAD